MGLNKFATTIAVALSLIAVVPAASAELVTFSESEGLVRRVIPFGDPAGTGSTDFTLGNTTFSGGEVTTFGNPAFYASAPTTYAIGAGGGEVVFTDAVQSVSFFFVDADPTAVFEAKIFDLSDILVVTLFSNDATFLADANNFVSAIATVGQAFKRIEFTGGLVDNFTSEIPLPGALPLMITALGGISLFRRRKQKQL